VGFVGSSVLLQLPAILGFNKYVTEPLFAEDSFTKQAVMRRNFRIPECAHDIRYPPNIDTFSKERTVGVEGKSVAKSSSGSVKRDLSESDTGTWHLSPELSKKFTEKHHGRVWFGFLNWSGVNPGDTITSFKYELSQGSVKSPKTDVENGVPHLQTFSSCIFL